VKLLDVVTLTEFNRLLQCSVLKCTKSEGVRDTHRLNKMDSVMSVLLCGGRDIYAIHSGKGLLRIVERKYPVKLLGNDEEPSWVWAEARKP
jgi:hypothetical protein